MGESWNCMSGDRGTLVQRVRVSSFGNGEEWCFEGFRVWEFGRRLYAQSRPLKGRRIWMQAG